MSNLHELMDEQDEIAWAKEKKGLCNAVLKNMLEEAVADYFENGNYNTPEELDKWLDETYSSFVETRNEIRKYYDANIYG